MLALCRLAKEQGLLQGDLNDLQELALSVLITDAEKRASDLEWQRFKFQAIAAHPELAKTILELDDPRQEEDELAEPLTDEQMDKYVPLTHEEIGATVDLLEGFGLKMS